MQLSLARVITYIFVTRLEGMVRYAGQLLAPLRALAFGQGFFCPSGVFAIFMHFFYIQ